MKRTITLLTIALLTASGLEAKPISVVADEETYKSVVMPFLSTYCTSCHGAKKSKGDVTLNEISAELAKGKDIDLWNSVLNQLVLSEMPPAKEKKTAHSKRNQQGGRLD